MTQRIDANLLAMIDGALGYVDLRTHDGADAATVPHRVLFVVHKQGANRQIIWVFWRINRELTVEITPVVPPEGEATASIAQHVVRRLARR